MMDAVLAPLFAPFLASLAAWLGMLATLVGSGRNVLAGLGVGAGRASRTPWPRRALRAIGSRSWLRRLARVERVDAKLGAAGARVLVEEVVGSKALLGLAGAVVAIVLPMPIPLISPVLALAGFRIPDLVLGRAASARLRLADREIPLLLDLLAAAASSGLSGQLALRRVVGAIEGPLAEELQQAIRAADLGGRWRDELQLASDRLGLPDLRRTTAALARSDSLGSSLSESLATIAADAREARRAATTERARKAPVKMLFPLVFLVLPAFLLLTVVPVLLTTLQSIR